MKSKWIIGVLILVILALSAALYFITQNKKIVEETPADVILNSLKENDKVQSPLIITGTARGFWFFEASFPMQVEDEKGTILGIGIAQAQGEWMTENFVSFSGTIKFNHAGASRGFLVLKKDNPSGLPQHDKEMRIPVRF